MNIQQTVKDYYGKTLSSSADLKTDACCTIADTPDHLRAALANIHPEVKARYYGCGLIAPLALEGRRILDLGSGAGQDVYALAQLVGPKGAVVGVDMTPEQLARGIRWLTLKYHSLAHRTRLARAAWRNDKLFCDFTPSKRALYIGALNYFQVWQWRYRMTPSIAWLYGRLAPLYKYRHVGDLLRRTNFWAPSEIPADSRPVALSTSSPFAERAGAMAPGRGKCLQPSRL